MKRKEVAKGENFPEKFDINLWESNKVFEKSLQQHNISIISSNQLSANGNSSAENDHRRRSKAGVKEIVNEGDYDTPL